MIEWILAANPSKLAIGKRTVHSIPGFVTLGKTLRVLSKILPLYHFVNMLYAL